MHNPIESFRGRQNNLENKNFLAVYLDTIEQKAKDIVYSRLCGHLDSCLDFSFNDLGLEGMKASILNSSLESKYSEELISILQGNRGDYALYVLRTIIKGNSKSNIVKQIKLAFQGCERGILFIESFEEWNGELLSDLIEFLMDKSEWEIALIIDLPGDVTSFHINLRLDVSQKLLINHQRIRHFGEETADLLYSFIRNKEFPVLSKQLFGALLQSKTRSEFFYLLKSSFLYNENFMSQLRTNRNKVLWQNKNEMNRIKEEWFNAFDKLCTLLEFTEIVDMPRASIFTKAYVSPKIEESGETSHLIAFLRSKNYNLEKWLNLLLHVFSRSEVLELEKGYERISVTSSRTSIEEARFIKWKDTFAMPKLRAEIFTKLDSFENDIKKEGLIIIGKSRHTSPDILQETVQALMQEDNTHDMAVVFQLIAPSGINIDLNAVFSEFVRLNPTEKLPDLQVRFLNSCQELARLGLVIQSMKGRTGRYFLTKNVFGIATTYNTVG